MRMISHLGHKYVELLRPICKTNRSIFGLLAAAVVVMAAFTATTSLPDSATAVTSPAPPTVLIFGDSIMYETRAAIAYQFKAHPTWKYKNFTYPGIAVCNMQAVLNSYIGIQGPKIVVLQTNGNMYTDCMKDSQGNQLIYGSQAWLNKYKTDLDLFFKTTSDAHAKVLFVNTPPVSWPPNNDAVNQLINLARTEAGKYHGVSITNGPRNAVSNNGVFTATKTCLASETAAMGCNMQSKTILVRAPDGVHLCPATTSPGLGQLCSVYSSGEVRFSQAIINNVLKMPAPLLP